MKFKLNGKILILCLSVIPSLTIDVYSQTRYGTGTGTGGGSYSSYYGYYAGSLASSTGATLIGAYAGYNNTNYSYYSTFIGYYSGYATNGGDYNTFLGSYSGRYNTSGGHNVFLGYRSGYYNSEGSLNTSIGSYSGYKNTTGSGNVFLGNYAGYNETGSDKLYIDNSPTFPPLIWGDFSTNQVGINMNTPSGYAFGVSGSVYSTGNLRIDGGYIDDDETFGGSIDDWIRLNGQIEMQPSHSMVGLQINSYNSTDYLALTQNAGSSYLSETSSYNAFFLKGTDRNAFLGGDLYGLEGQSDPNFISGLYKFGGLYLTWNSSTHGTTDYHSIRSTNGITYGDDITINSYDNIRINIDSDNNNIASGFEIGHHTTDIANILFKVESPTGDVGIGIDDPAYKLDVAGSINASEFLINGSPLVSNWIKNGTSIYYNTGNVGIGLILPEESLHINGNIRGNQSGALRVSTGYGFVDVGPKDVDKTSLITDRPYFYLNKPIRVDEGLLSSWDEDLQLQTSGTTRLSISNTTGNIGIGTTPKTAYKLSVEGFIGAREVNVNQDVWPDYVFKEDYKLLSLQEIEQYIKSNSHLPNMPSEKEIYENGLNLGEMDAKLLEQIEQLVLHTIAQEKELKEKEKRIKALEEKEKRLSELEERLAKLEQLIQTKE